MEPPPLCKEKGHCKNVYNNLLYRHPDFTYQQFDYRFLMLKNAITRNQFVEKFDKFVKYVMYRTYEDLVGMYQGVLNFVPNMMVPSYIFTIR